MQTRSILISAILCGGLAACGDTVGEQLALGGATGAGVAAVTDGNIVQGAAIGAAANTVACQTDIADCD